MDKFTNTAVFNFENALRGMRNPLNSWDRSDSLFGYDDEEHMVDRCADVVDIWVEQELKSRNIESGPGEGVYEELWKRYMDWLWGQGIIDEDYSIEQCAFIGPNDLNLAQRLIKSGPEHCKFLRQIFVTVDITMPLYWWKEFDTYKIGTTANSTSTMHTLTKNKITKDMFAFDNTDIIVTEGHSIDGDWELTFEDCIDDILTICNNLRDKYLETNDKRYWRALVQTLPEAWLQTRTVTMSYANLRNMYFQRKDHKLQEWHDFCDWIKTLPYAYELIYFTGENNENFKTN